MGLDIFKKYDRIAEGFPYTPDNEHLEVPSDDMFITPGGTCTQSFEFPFWIGNDEECECRTIEAIYTQGTDLLEYVLAGAIVTVNWKDIWENKKCSVKITLEPSVSAKFNYYNQDCHIQLKFIMANGDLIYTEKMLLKIISATDHMLY